MGPLGCLGIARRMIAPGSDVVAGDDALEWFGIVLADSPVRTGDEARQLWP